uniref:ABC transporter ATP-binding protein n=1 Tax=Castellaniella defragrans TaxID=75697 RepID=UPI00333EC624
MSSEVSAGDIAIRVEGLGKAYPIFDKPRDRLLQMFLRGKKALFHEFWALRDVSFTVLKGETVGIIGRNGSGKSTLLQMICGTLNPTLGHITVNGKVAALLELGAGFNPEFTGRENVYMAASLYGLSTEQVDARFNKIAMFADIGEHLDHPVKTYSSGMYVRLAFAVIAHVDADILVIDEALAVGDAVFTQKCMRFIREFQKSGTLLFVSHDMGSVLNLCKSAIWLGNGKIVRMGESKAISEAYLQYTLQEIYGEEAKLAPVESTQGAKLEFESDALLDDVDEESIQRDAILDYESSNRIKNNLNAANGWKSGGAEIIDIEFATVDGKSAPVLKGGERVQLRIRARANQDLPHPILGFIVRDRLGQDLFGENTLPFTANCPQPMEKGTVFEGVFVFTLPMLPNGTYSVMASVADGDLHNNVQHHLLHDAMFINVSSSKVRWGLVGIRFDHVSLRSSS